MIRRETLLADGARAWTLISQIEHARISAQLASQARGTFGATPQRAASSPTPASLRQEVLDAILHHDDGWAEWERALRLDPQRRRPLSFTELEPAEAIAIWTSSIETAAAIGPLAAWMVAGHFMRLLDHGDSLHDEAVAMEWRAQMADQRTAWFAEWQARDPLVHTSAIAAEALQWLWTFDAASLWFCTTCRASCEATAKATTPYRAGVDTPLEMVLEADVTRDGRAHVAPWRFAVDFMVIAAEGLQAPAREYVDWEEIQASARPNRLKWLLAAAPVTPQYAEGSASPPLP